MSFRIKIAALMLSSLALFAAACGTDSPTTVDSGSGAQAQDDGADAPADAEDSDAPGDAEDSDAPGDAEDGDAPVPGDAEDGDAPVPGDAEDGDAPIPVEPDGGSGDGAEPLPVDPEDDDAPIPVEPDGGIGDGAGPIPVDGEGDGPFPVEPDGGIGDGAEPLPGYEEEPDTGTWHGAEVAETNCPGMTWQRVQASTFSFSIPAEFVEETRQGTDSEYGRWAHNGIEVAYDYGWYGFSVASYEGAEVEPVDYSGRLGEFSVVRLETSPNSENNYVGVAFPELSRDGGQWNQLGILVGHDDPNDEIIGRCIVRSIEWNE